MMMVLKIGPPWEAWRALSKIAAKTEDVAYYRTKRESETLEIGLNEPVAEYFARVHIVLMKLERHNIITPAREIKHIVLNSLTSRFPNETCLCAMRGDFELKDLENGLARAEKFRSEQKGRSASFHALAVARAGGGQTGTRGGARGRGRQGRRSGGRHDDGRGRNQQQGYPRQMHPGQQHQPPAAMPHQSPAWQHQHQHQPQFRSHNSRDHSSSSPTPGAAGREHLTISSPTPGAAGEDHLPNSSEEERLTSRDHDIGEEISHTNSASCVSSAARRSICPQTA